MKTTYVLIDYENVQVKSLALLKGDHFRVMVFLGPKNTKIGADLVMAMQALGSKAEYVKLDAAGHNALDFHITYYLGGLVAMDATARFCIISKDTGFDSLIEHIKQKKIECVRADSIEAMLGVKVPPEDKKIALVVATKVAVAKTPAAVKQKAEALVDRVLGNLVKRVAGKPRTEKALRSTIKQVCGAQYSEKELEVVFARLVKMGIVTVEGTKVSYQLPLSV